jgi:hypothetical protein
LAGTEAPSAEGMAVPAHLTTKRVLKNEAQRVALKVEMG